MSHQCKRIIILGLVLILSSGCSKQPPVQTEIAGDGKSPKQAGLGSSDDLLQGSGNPLLGSSHQQEAGLTQPKQDGPPGAGEDAGSATTDKKSPVVPAEGFRVAKGIDKAGQGTIHFLVPEEWEEAPPRSSMRLHQVVLPAVTEGGTAGELAVFGQMGGNVQMNVDRWIGQFSQPDGSASKEKADVEKMSGDNHPFTLVDLQGTMGAMNMPGMPPAEEKENWQMLGAVIESPNGNWYVKATGPAEVLGPCREKFTALCKSVHIKPGQKPAGSGGY